MPRFADEHYHRLSKRHVEITLEIARLEAEQDEIEDKMRWIEDKYHLDHAYIRRLDEEGL